MKTDYTPPTCSVMGCNNPSHHTNVKIGSTEYTHMCPEHYEEVREVRDRNRPKCTVPGCNKLAHLIGYNSNGLPVWRKTCYPHHQESFSYNRKQSDAVDLTGFYETDIIDRPSYGDLNPFMENIDD